MKKILIASCILYSIVGTFALAANSPVVQVVSYKEPLGLYYSLQGWGSGSIIDNKGHIITNNHVVDDGAGGISDDFAICMTDNPALPPRCYYTASVVSRDIDADIAILQLDTMDIFGNKVSFDTLAILNMDMDYTPKSGDSVVARGYPWVGANTITETQGIIAGTVQYNDNTYIKTDTLIAGGNSGGPLIRNGKMIGINTFLVGGGYDPSLGYSLLIREARDLIDSAVLSTEKLQSNSAQFADFLKQIDMFSTQKKITDPLISIGLNQEYVINSYIPASNIMATLSNGSMTSVSEFGFYHIQTPRLENIESLKIYLSSVTGGLIPLLDPVKIGGKDFYEISFEDMDADKTQNTFFYIALIDKTHLLILNLETPIPTKNTLSIIETSVKNFLANITFPQTFVFPKISDIPLPGGISIIVKGNTAISYSISDYDGFLSNYIENMQDFVMVRNYIDSFWQKAQIAVFKNSFSTEDYTPDIWLKNIADEMYKAPIVKKQVTYKGHAGFLICSPDFVRDASGKNQESIQCETTFFVGDNNDYILSAQMILPKKQLRRIDSLMIQYLDRMLRVPEVGETVFSTGNDTLDGGYSDVDHQSIEYRTVLNTLVENGVLQNRPQFEGDAPLRWREYIALYVWAVYHKKMTDTMTTEGATIEKLLSFLPVNMNDYAEDDNWQIDGVHSLIRLLVAGGSLSKYDFDTIYDFSNAFGESEAEHADAWNTISAFESTYFSDRNLMKTTPYNARQIITYNPFTGLDIRSRDEVRKIAFFRNTQKDKEYANKILQCDTNSLLYFSLECREIRKKSLLDSLTYNVLTKGKAIQYILGNIDLSLWGNSSLKR